MSELHKLQIDDQCWRINSVNTVAFLCRVVDVSARAICVMDVESTTHQNSPLWFDKDTGRAAGRNDDQPAPHLVTYDDPVIATLRARNVIDATARKHRSYRGRISELLAKLPGAPEVWEEAFTLLEEWEDWSHDAEEGDRNADVAETVLATPATK